MSSEMCQRTAFLFFREGSSLPLSPPLFPFIPPVRQLRNASCERVNGVASGAPLSSPLLFSAAGLESLSERSRSCDRSPRFSFLPNPSFFSFRRADGRSFNLFLRTTGSEAPLSLLLRREGTPDYFFSLENALPFFHRFLSSSWSSASHRAGDSLFLSLAAILNVSF